MIMKAIITSTDLDGVTLRVTGNKVSSNDPTKVPLSSVNAANGVAGLDGSGKLTVDLFPSSMLGAVSYQGVWNAATNTPTLASGVGTKGSYYVVNVSGTTAIDGNHLWKVGDHILFDGIKWDQVIGGEVAVRSVAGRTGDITLGTSDLGDFETKTHDLIATDTAGLRSSVTNLSSSVSAHQETLNLQAFQVSNLTSSLSTTNSNVATLSTGLMSEVSTMLRLSSSLTSNISQTIAVSTSTANLASSLSNLNVLVQGISTSAPNFSGGDLGSLLVQQSPTVTSTIPIGANGQMLIVKNGEPTWSSEIDFGIF